MRLSFASRVLLIAAVWIFAGHPPAHSDEPIRASGPPTADRLPLDEAYPALLATTEIARWKFASAEEAWPALHDCKVHSGDGVLRIEATGDDPYLRIPQLAVQGPLELRFRMKTTARGPAEVFWASKSHPNLGPHQSLRIHTENDGTWHDYTVRLIAPEEYNYLRLDPTTGPGVVELSGAVLLRPTTHPLQFTSIASDGATVRASVRSSGPSPREVTIGQSTHTIPPGETREFTFTPPPAGRFQTVQLSASSAGLAPLVRTLHLYRPVAALDAEVLGNEKLQVRVARDGSGLEFVREGQVVGIAFPLAEQSGRAVQLALRREGAELQLQGGPIERMTISKLEDEVRIDLVAREDVVGPALRALGEMEQCLLAGVEHLEKGERSSSSLDLEGPAHLRYSPDPLLVTMPLAAAVTSRGSLAVLWNDPLLQPSFAAPNVYDGTSDVRMAIQGKAMSLRVRLGKSYQQGERLEDAIAWAVRSRGLPPLPESPRSAEAQRELSLAALTGAVKTPSGWLHVAGANASQAHYFSDHASAIWRLTDRLPELPQLTPGGGHIENPAAFFASGRTDKWLAWSRARVKQMLSEQKPDGSFHYQGKYQRGHWEDTASGYCAAHAVILLDHAWHTGDAEAQAAGVKTLDYMTRFRTPRGAQTWEIPLHTPDIYASALLVRAYVRGFALTGKAEYLAEARRWALSGIPLVYQWDCRPIMRYSTIAVLGATDWTGVNWMGLPVQWCGTVYAHSLTLLAEHDKTLDWNQVARGILIAAEQMQYSDGPHRGCLPDSFNLREQRRLPADINPTALVAVRLRLEGKLDALSVATAGQRRITAPFPVTIQGEKAIVQAQKGTPYEVLIDGARIVKIDSQGIDTIPLGEPAR